MVNLKEYKKAFNQSQDRFFGEKLKKDIVRKVES